MTRTEFDFEDLAERLTAIGTLTSPAELHGLLCGRLCGGKRYEEDDWVNSSLEFLDPAKVPDAEDKCVLVDLYHDALAQLQDHQLGFVPLLPDDDTDMPQRIGALGEWCHGFLNGFGTSGIGADTEMSAETSEALRDFAAFVQLDQDNTADEDSERDFLEIVEYVRVAALSVFMEMAMNETDQHAAAQENPTPEHTLH